MKETKEAKENTITLTIEKYDELINKIKANKEQIKRYERFFTNLSKSVRFDPKMILTGRVVDSGVRENNPFHLNKQFYIIWETEN